MKSNKKYDEQVSGDRNPVLKKMKEKRNKVIYTLYKLEKWTRGRTNLAIESTINQMDRRKENGKTNLFLFRIIKEHRCSKVDIRYQGIRVYFSN